jgi:hypothetical protein
MRIVHTTICEIGVVQKLRGQDELGYQKVPIFVDVENEKCPHGGR